AFGARSDQSLGRAVSHAPVSSPGRHCLLDRGKALGPFDAGLSPCQHLTSCGCSIVVPSNSAPPGDSRCLAGSGHLCSSPCSGRIRGLGGRTQEYVVRNFLFWIDPGVFEFRAGPEQNAVLCHRSSSVFAGDVGEADCGHTAGSDSDHVVVEARPAGLETRSPPAGSIHHSLDCRRHVQYLDGARVQRLRARNNDAFDIATITRGWTGFLLLSREDLLAIQPFFHVPALESESQRLVAIPFSGYSIFHLGCRMAAANALACPAGRPSFLCRDPVSAPRFFQC